MLSLTRAASRTATSLLAALFGIVVLSLIGAGALAWRLTAGPLDVTWLVPRFGPVLAPGWTAGRLTVQIVKTAAGHAVRVEIVDADREANQGEPTEAVHDAVADLALAPLLTGRLQVSRLALDGLRLYLTTPRPGASPEEGSGPDLQRVLSRLQHLSITDARAEIAEGTIGQTLSVHDADAEIDRGPDGVLHGRASATASTATLTMHADAVGSYGPAGGTVQATIPAVNPAALAQAIPALAAAGALDATMAVRAEAAFGADLTLQHAGLHAEAGPGSVQLPKQRGGTSPGRFTSATLDLDGTPARIVLRGLNLVLTPSSGNPASNVVISGAADRADGRVTARIAVDIDRVAFADLGSLWPTGVGGDSRAWLTENLSAGSAHDGHIAFTLVGTENGDDLDVTQAGGTLIGDDVTLWWLRPVPPVQHVHAVLAWQNPDTMLITLSGGRQGGLEAKAGTVRITGLAGRDQVGFIDADLAGPIADVISLLKHPRLQLLSKHPLPLTSPSGAMTGHISIRLPLDAKVDIDQVAIHAMGQLASVHLGGIAAGRDIDRGQLAFDVTNDGLSITGDAQVARIPTQLAVTMDFKDGPKTQVLQHVTASMLVTKADADKAGLGVIGLDGGSLTALVDYAERRDGTSIIQLNTELKDAKFITPFGWSKVAGTPGHAEGRALLDHGRLVGLDGLRAEAPGLSVVARSDLVNGLPSVVHLERGDIGRSSATGTIVLPQRAGEAYRISLAGPRLDLEGRLKTVDAPAASDTPQSASTENGKTDSGKAGSPYVLDLRFDRVVLGPNHGLGPVALTAVGTGGHLTTAHLSTGGQERARADLVTAGAVRHLTASARDLGSLLRDTDLASEVNGGDVTVDGTFDDRIAGSPFDGKFDLRGFKVQGAPVAGKLLQALTVYGVLDALRGPGLAFDRFETPFRLKGSVLDVEDARAFSSSLGFTASGRLDFGRKQIDMSGTIVPAYFFNSLPGRIPLIGRMFSPEKGSGLFAANYALRGALTDPAVSINPLSALTPGFTRRFFDLFD